MDNKKIPTWLGTVIIIIFAATVGAFVWKYEEENEQIQIPASNIPAKQETISSENQEQHGQIENQTPPIKKISPLDNINVSNFEKWKTYSDSKINITLKYPPELYQSTTNGKIIFDYLSPSDPSQKDEGSILTHFNISLEQKNADQYIDMYKLDALENFKKEQIKINNFPAIQITYSDAFTGNPMRTILIPKESNTIIIHYSEGNKLKDVFNKMLSTVNIHN